MFTAIFLPILVEHGLNLAAPFLSVGAVWIAARIHKMTGVNIEKQLSELFNSVLNRAAEAVVREGISDPVTAVINSVRATNPDLVKRLKLDSPAARAVFAEVANRAVKAAKSKALGRTL